MKHVDGGILDHGTCHIGKRLEQKLIKFAVLEIIILDLAGFGCVCHIVWRIGDNQIGCQGAGGGKKLVIFHAGSLSVPVRELSDAFMKENPGVSVKIVGHSDSDGDDAMNLDLSKRRAESVKNELSGKFGIEASRMETEGAGENRPVAPNDTPANKAMNRRVEFIKK